MCVCVCVYFSTFFILIGPPDSVTECKVTNKTFSSLFVACKAGYDGGIPQTFVIEVHEQRYYDDFIKRQREASIDGTTLTSSSSDGNTYSSFGGLHSGTTIGGISGMTPLPPSPISRLEMLHEPRFALENLPPGTGFTLVIYAKNSKVSCMILNYVA